MSTTPPDPEPTTEPQTDAAPQVDGGTALRVRWALTGAGVALGLVIATALTVIALGGDHGRRHGRPMTVTEAAMNAMHGARPGDDGAGGPPPMPPGDGPARTRDEQAPFGEEQAARDADATAKTSARNLVSMIEACFTDSQDYRRCTSPTNGLGENTGLDFRTVNVEARTATTWKVTSASKTGNTFMITRHNDGTVTRSCTAEAPLGACGPSREW